jgi:hypothetical protein
MFMTLVPSCFKKLSYFAGGCFTKQKSNCFQDLQDIDVFVEWDEPPFEALSMILNFQKTIKEIEYVSVKHHSLDFKHGPYLFSIIFCFRPIEHVVSQFIFSGTRIFSPVDSCKIQCDASLFNPSQLSIAFDEIFLKTTSESQARDLFRVNYVPFDNMDNKKDSRLILNIVDIFHLMKCHGKGFAMNLQDLVQVDRKFKERMTEIKPHMVSQASLVKVRMILSYLSSVMKVPNKNKYTQILLMDGSIESLCEIDN